MLESVLDRRSDLNPVAIVGDIHGCYFTLTEGLLPALGFNPDGTHPEGIRLVSVGDLHDRGGIFALENGDPSTSGAVNVLRWAMKWSALGVLDVVDSNHGKKLARKLITGERLDKDGEPFKHGLSDTLEDIDLQPDVTELSEAISSFLSSRPSVALYSGGPTGTIAVAHAAVHPSFLKEGVRSRREKDYCIYPREFEWYGSASVVVGHVVTDGPVYQRSARSDGEQAGPVIRIDTGAADGNGLTAYLSHEQRTITVPTDPRDLPDDARRWRNRFDV